MPLTSANTSALVGGATGDHMATQRQTESQIKCRVNRPFWKDGRVHDIGSELVLPAALASELYAAGKVERAENEPSDYHRQQLADAKARQARKKTAKPVAA
jgi:hypothetical protein